MSSETFSGGKTWKPLAFIRIINLAVKREKLYQRFHKEALINLKNDINMAENGRNTWESYIAEVIDYTNSTLKNMNAADIKKFVIAHWNWFQDTYHQFL